MHVFNREQSIWNYLPMFYVLSPDDWILAWCWVAGDSVPSHVHNQWWSKSVKQCGITIPHSLYIFSVLFVVWDSKPLATRAIVNMDSVLVTFIKWFVLQLSKSLLSFCGSLAPSNGGFIGRRPRPILKTLGTPSLIWINFNPIWTK